MGLKQWERVVDTEEFEKENTADVDCRTWRWAVAFVHCGKVTRRGEEEKHDNVCKRKHEGETGVGGDQAGSNEDGARINRQVARNVTTWGTLKVPLLPGGMVGR